VRGGAGIGGGERGGGRQGVVRVAQGGDVSNERVAAGFENHGIIRQIKLERLPFFSTPIYPGPMKWIKPCLSPAADGRRSLLITD